MKSHNHQKCSKRNFSYSLLIIKSDFRVFDIYAHNDLNCWGIKPFLFRGGLLLQVDRQLSACGTWVYRRRAVHGGLSKGSQPLFTRVSEKTTENSKGLGRQGRPGFEPGTSRLPVLSATSPPLLGPHSRETEVECAKHSAKETLL